MPFSDLEKHMDVCRELYTKIATHQIYVDYPSPTAFVSNAMKLVSQPDSVSILAEFYNKIKAYRDWIVEDVVQKILNDDTIRDDDSARYTANIVAQLGQHPKPVDEADSITEAAKNLLIKQIKEQASAEYIARENRENAIRALQDYVTAEMNRMNAGDYEYGKETETLENKFNKKVGDVLGDYFQDYDTNALKESMMGTFLENKQTIDELQEAALNSFMDTGMKGAKFWVDLASDYDMTAEQGPLSEEKKVANAIVQATEDPIDYAINKIEKNASQYGMEMNVKEVRYTLVGLNNVDDKIIFYPEDVIRVPFHIIQPTFYENIRAYIDGVVSESTTFSQYYILDSYKKLEKAIKGYTPSIQELIWKTWSTMNLNRLKNTIRITIPTERTYNTMADLVVELYDKVIDLQLHPSMTEQAVIAWLKENDIDELPTQGSGVAAVAKFLVTERYEDFCKSKNLVAKTTAVAKTSALLATVKSIIDTITKSQPNLDKALNAESNSANEALSAFRDKFTKLLDIGTEFAGFAAAVGGINLGSALVAIPGFAAEAKKAIDLRATAKRELIAAEAQLLEATRALQDPANVNAATVANKTKIESKIFALGVLLTKKLRQFIWDIVEILKRVITICSTILKITGVGAVVGFSIDAVKALINLIQQSYFLGRAVYKKYHNTKGVDRHAAADQFINDAFEDEDAYAAGIIIQMGANKGVVDEHLSSCTHQDGFVQQIYEMKTNNELVTLASCKKAMNANLFKALSSKPAATLTRLLFPGSGFIKSFA